MAVLDRFLHYVTFDTQSSETTGVTPSTPGQRRFAEALVAELQAIGLEEISLDENGYLMATLPANTEKAVPTIGFIAHLDTSPDLSGRDVKPRIVAYTGGDIVLNEAQRIVLSPDMFPELNDYVGQELVVTDGTTLLGADDKAGVAAIIEAMRELKEHPEWIHGKIRIAFTPDEEIGAGADHFDVEKFGCAWGYTIDGGQVGELEYENFNAADAVLTVHGIGVHPGSAKDVMVNAAAVAMEFAAMLPTDEVPEKTEGYEGFFHLHDMSGSVTEARLRYIIRDHDRAKFEARKALFAECAAKINETYGPGTAEAVIRDSYYNMKEKIDPHPELIEHARAAFAKNGVEMRCVPIRGGTDGARLSWDGLPCPNLPTGGYNYHGVREWIPVESLGLMTDVLVDLVHSFAEARV